MTNVVKQSSIRILQRILRVFEKDISSNLMSQHHHKPQLLSCGETQEICDAIGVEKDYFPTVFCATPGYSSSQVIRDNK